MSHLRGVLVVSMCLVFAACSSDEDAAPQWMAHDEIQLGAFSPIGIAVQDSMLWMSDGDNNQLGVWNADGEQVDVLMGFDRPMHIAAHDGRIYVPEYGSDSIQIIGGPGQSALVVDDSLDAPAGIDVSEDDIAIADFYNHRVLVKHEDEWLSFGEEGNGPGQFYYPTDVQLKHGMIYVADAYNNRVQVLNTAGETVLLFGKEHGMNAATGLFVNEEQIFVTDFENDRLLIFDLDGVLEQTISDLEKPTDVLTYADKLFVTSYADKKVHVFRK